MGSQFTMYTKNQACCPQEVQSDHDVTLQSNEHALRADAWYFPFAVGYTAEQNHQVKEPLCMREQ